MSYCCIPDAGLVTNINEAVYDEQGFNQSISCLCQLPVGMLWEPMASQASSCHLCNFSNKYKTTLLFYAHKENQPIKASGTF